jgi:hypothetical protein
MQSITALVHGDEQVRFGLEQDAIAHGPDLPSIRIPHSYLSIPLGMVVRLGQWYYRGLCD